MKRTIFMHLKAFACDRSGGTAIEYGLIGALISVVLIGAVTALNSAMIEMFEYIRSFVVPVLSGS